MVEDLEALFVLSVTRVMQTNMKTLKPISEVVKEAHINGLKKAQNSKEIIDDRTVLSYGYYSTLVGYEITQDRLDTYKAIEGMIDYQIESGVPGSTIYVLETIKQELKTLFNIKDN